MISKLRLAISASGRSFVLILNDRRRLGLVVMDGTALAIIDALLGCNAISKVPRAAGYRASDFVLCGDRARLLRCLERRSSLARSGRLQGGRLVAATDRPSDTMGPVSCTAVDHQQRTRDDGPNCALGRLSGATSRCAGPGAGRA